MMQLAPPSLSFWIWLKESKDFLLKFYKFLKEIFQSCHCFSRKVFFWLFQILKIGFSNFPRPFHAKLTFFRRNEAFFSFFKSWNCTQHSSRICQEFPRLGLKFLDFSTTSPNQTSLTFVTVLNFPKNCKSVFQKIFKTSRKFWTYFESFWKWLKNISGNFAKIRGKL